MTSEPQFDAKQQQRLSEIVTDLHSAMPRQKIKAIITKTAAPYGVTYDEVMGESTARGCEYVDNHGQRVVSKPIVQARAACMTAVRDSVREGDKPISYPSMGRIFKRHHTTVMDAVRRHRATSPPPPPPPLEENHAPG